jgi:prepilin peptidase CpaA
MQELLLPTTQAVLLSALLTAAAVYDLHSYRIPNFINYSGMLMSISFHVWLSSTTGLMFSLMGIGAGIALLIIPYLFGGMGAGDAKLMGMVGGFLGVKSVFFAFLASALVGGLYALIVIIVHRARHQKWLVSINHGALMRIASGEKTSFLHSESEDAKSKPRLCYGVAIAIGTIAYVVWNITHGYPI